MKTNNINKIKKIEKIIKKPFPSELIPLFENQKEPEEFAIKNEQENRVEYIHDWKTLDGVLNSLTMIDKKILPRSYIPIAIDGGGNLFIYSVSSEDYGYIYYIDFDQLENDDYPFKVLLAKSYSEFLSKLYIEEPEEDPDDWRIQLIKKLDAEIENNKIAE